MTKINNTGAGIPRTTGPDPSEPMKDASRASETTSTPAETSVKQTQVDKYATGDLHASGDRVKSHLESEFKKGIPVNKEDLATQMAKKQPTFAPPYVPVGPVVLGDNIGVPGQTPETRQMNLRPDQFQINDQGNLVITNEKLIDFFKSLKESGQEILLGITPKKPEEK